MAINLIPDVTSKICEFLECGDLFVYDSSFRTTPGSWYRQGVYDSRFFSDVNTDLVKTEIIGLRDTLSFLQSQNLFTVPGVVTEIAKERDVVSTSIRFMNQTEKEVRERLGGRTHGNSFNRSKESKLLLEEIRDLLHQCYIDARRRILPIDDRPKYDELEQRVIRITERTGSRINFYPHEFRAKPKMQKDLHTDEQLVAAGFYALLHYSRNVTILSRDSDLVRITENLLHNGNGNIPPSLLRKRRLRIYNISSEKGLVCGYDSARLN